MWGKSKKDSKEAVEPPKSTNSEVVASSVESNAFSKVSSKIRNKKLMLILTALVIVVIAGLIVWKNQRDKNNEIPENASYSITDEQFAQARVSTLKQSAPADTASLEDKKAYYEELIVTEHTANNDNGTKEAYEHAVAALGESNLPYNAYMAAASSYAKLGDKQKAESVLSVAEQSVKATTTDESLLEDFLKGISDLRKEIAG